MQGLPKNIILEFNPETLEDVRKKSNFNKTEDLIEAINIFSNWVQKQQHFTKKDFGIGRLKCVDQSIKNITMQCILKDKMLEFHPDTLTGVRKLYNLDKPEEINRAIDILEEWLKQQNHFTKKKFSRDYIERGIITAKGSMERAKSRLDKTCTFRTLMPHYFGDFDLRNDFKELDGLITHAALPKLTKDHERVFIIRNVGKKFYPTFCLHYFQMANVFAEYVRLRDYCQSYIIIVDYSDINLTELISNFNVVDARQGLTILMEAYGMRVKGIHIVSSSKLIDMIVSLFKQVFSKKIGDRIYVHKTLDALPNIIEKAVLPKEYGGDERSLQQLHDEWVEVLSSQEHRDYMKEMNRARTDESLRQTDTFNDIYAGMPGTFRTLSVD